MTMRMYGGARGHAHFLRSNLIKPSSLFPTPAAFGWRLLRKTVVSPTERTLLSVGAPVADTMEVWTPEERPRDSPQRSSHRMWDT